MGLKLLRSQKGYSLPELLMAAAIILMISSIVLAGLKAFSEQRRKVNVTLLALSLQSSLQASFKDLDNYPQEMQNILKNGTEEYESISFKSGWNAEESTLPTDDRTFVTIGKNVSFNLKKEQLPLNDPKGVIRLYTKIQQIPKSTTVPFPLYKIGYRIVFNDKKIPHIGSPLMKDQEPEEFNETDFLETIPHELYMGKSRGKGETQGLVQCDPNIDIGIHGFDRDTGAPICIEKIYGDAPPKSFPRTLSFVEGYYGDDNIGSKPHVTMNYRPFNPFRPPPNYIFQKINTLAMDPDGPKTGIRYVFIYKKNVQFFKAHTDWGRATAKCPTSFYKAAKTSGICQIVGEKAIPGSCPAYDEKGNAIGSVPCSPNCARGNNISYSGGGNTVTCTFVRPNCPNGGSWDAQLRVIQSPSDCTLSVPETQEI